MENISLAAKYRPQTFATMLGQDTIKKVLSEAAFHNKVAPAYLLSGTRGVGKTTVARIFAKALNCEKANERTNGEPCNTCLACKSITQGSFVDVLEMDGASHTGVDDARRITEMVQYAPLEGRYKIIIIDEAHMLSKNAFNALLKTLEEPPSHTVFIFASTELHKFPITIISRCQHFVCRSITESDLRKHLRFVLDSEGKNFEDEAVKIIAKRGAGSVRDSMSLLDQSLALAGSSPLTAELTRLVLGLGSKDILSNLLSAIAANNQLEVSKSVQSMMLQGIDISYFLRELAQLWRSFFLISKYGKDAFEMLELSEDDASEVLKMSKLFTPAFMHSAWQMTLEAQRKITTGLEPAVTLELFLINLSLLPELIPIAELKDVYEANEFQTSLTTPTSTHPASEVEKKKIIDIPIQNEDTKPQIEEIENNSSIETKEEFDLITEIKEETSLLEVENTFTIAETVNEIPLISESEDNSDESLDFKHFLVYLKENNYKELYNKVQHIEEFLVEKNNKTEAISYKVVIDATSLTNAKQLNAETCKQLESLLLEWSGNKVEVEVNITNLNKSPIELREELEKMPIIQEIQTLFNANITTCKSEKGE